MGEEIYLLEKTKVNIPKEITTDFWLFDDEVALELKYDKEGKFLGFKEVKDSVPFVDFKKEVLEKAKELGESKF